MGKYIRREFDYKNLLGYGTRDFERKVSYKKTTKTVYINTKLEFLK